MIVELSETVTTLTKRIARLEEKTIKKAECKCQTFYFNGKELTDREIIYLIDYDFFDFIGKLEKEVGADKNQLRNLYNKAKKKQQLEKEFQKNGNC